ncbi:MFS transporter [Streptomyces sp. ZAF1911]|uniref:MFS transporter n=1 Tax=Streptomyces sp. ZAF1911 TaxID=2944129 RepID=UPI00237B6AAE|nr:MFS transporter [Streptomyces sp. ZAF1911]MDD9376886.1 MFS transporter [Streptomyces sp. ZAF1911]
MHGTATGAGPVEEPVDEIRPSIAPPPGPPVRRATRALAALGLSAFVVGTAEFAVIGVLDRMAESLHVSAATAGLLVTAYAVGVCLGGPLLAAMTLRLPRRLVLVGALGGYALANAVAALWADFAVVLVVRVLAGAVHGLFVGAASAAAAGLVPAERKGRAVAVVFGGIAAANLLGVPLATFAGQVLPWQYAFAGIAVLACAALLLTRAAVPSSVGGGGGQQALRAQFGHVAKAPVMALLAIAVLVFCGQFTAFTQLSGYLQDVVGVQGGAVGLYLLVFGAAGSAGTVLGGRLADRAAGTTVVAGTAVLVLVLTTLFLLGGRPVAVGVCVAVWGLAGFGLAPALQLRTIRRAGPGGDLAATLGASAGNAGIAVGAAVASGITGMYGYAVLPLAAAVICVVTLPLTWICRSEPAGGASVPAAP